MIVYEVIPLKGVGPVLLGMSREEARLAMGTEPQSFKEPFNSRDITDAYHAGGFQVSFDRGGKVEYIELSSLDPSFIVMYKGKEVFQIKANDLVEFISEDAPFDAEWPELGYGYVFPKLELSIWRPVIPEDQDDLDGQYFSTIGVGKQGYYSSGVVKGNVGES